MKTSLYLIALLTLTPGLIRADDTVFLPSVSYHIETIVEMGVEKEGQFHQLVKTTSKDERSQRETSSTIIESNTSSSTNKTKVKKTNPNKAKSRPKPSGLLGGIGRAFGGDFTGLASWGGNFLDHMAEPRYSYDVNYVYNTKDSASTTISNTIQSSWENSTKLSSVITKELKYDINKGFIRFTVNFSNIGERTFKITEPEFVVYLVLKDGHKIYVGKTSSIRDNSEIKTIGVNESISLPVKISNLDFPSLVENYKNAEGIAIKLQDLKVIHNDEHLAISEIKERFFKDYIQFDYYDENKRTIRYIKVSQDGINLSDFFALALRKKSFSINDHVNELNGPIPYIESISGKRSSKILFSELSNDKLRLQWRRWFSSVIDDNGLVYEPSTDRKIYPGYTLKLGYYGAKDVLPAEQYEPVIYSKENITLTSGNMISFPLDVKKGDVIKFTNIRFSDDIYANHVDISLEKMSRQEAEIESQNAALAQRNAIASNNGIGYVGGIYSNPTFEAPLQNIHLSPEQKNTWSMNKPYRMKVNGSSLKPVKPSAFFIQSHDQNTLKDEYARFLLQYMQIDRLSEFFNHYRVINYPEKTFGINSIRTNSDLNNARSFNQAIFRMTKARRPNEDLGKFLSRIIEEENILTYEITESVSEVDNYWNFLLPESTLHSSYISLAENAVNIPDTTTGIVLGDGYMINPVHVATNSSIGLVFPPMMQTFMQTADERIFLYLENVPSKIIFTSKHTEQPLSLGTTGYEITADVKILRY